MDWKDRLREIADKFSERMGGLGHRLGQGAERLRPARLKEGTNPRFVRAIGQAGESTLTLIRRQSMGFYGKALTILASTYYLSDVTALMIETVLPEPPAKKSISSSFNNRRTLKDYDQVISRNLFNSKGRIPEEPKETLAVGPGPAVKSSLPFNLLGTIVLQNELQSLATIQDKTASQVYPVRITDEIPTKAKITKIASRRVEFINLRNKKKEYIEIPEDARISSIRTTAPKPSAAAGKKAIDAVSDRRYSISRTEIEKTLSNLNEILTQALARPVSENGQPAGYRLSQIVKGSIYDQLGLKNGDILKGFDGQTVTDPALAWEKLSELKDLNQVELNIKRGGKEETLIYDIY